MPARGPRYEARRKFQTFYETGLPCKHGHVAKRYVSTGRCHTCQSQEVVKMKAAGYPSQKAWEARNPEQVREMRSTYRKENRERILEHRRAVAPAQYERNKARRRERALEDPIRLLAETTTYGLRRRTKLKGIPVDAQLLDPAFLEAWLRAQPNCLCCGVRFEVARYTRSRSAPSLDRLQAGQGYTLANTRLICVECNAAKNSATAKKHRQIADYMDREDTT